MREKKNLEKLLNLTRHSEQVRTNELSRRLADQRDAGNRLVQLKQYLSEYERGQHSGTLPELQNQRSFTLQLSQAIDEQKLRTKQLENQLKPSYKNWIMAKQRREAVENAIDDAIQEDIENQERALQQDLETYSARDQKRSLDGVAEEH